MKKIVLYFNGGKNRPREIARVPPVSTGADKILSVNAAALSRANSHKN